MADPKNERLWHAAATNDTRGAAEAIVAGAKIDYKAMYKAVSPDANPWNPSGGRLTPLSVAAYHGHTEMVRLLLQSGADPTVVNDWGQTILSFCKGPEVSILLQDALRERGGGNKDSALYLSPKALPSSPPNVVVTEVPDSPRRVSPANAGNLSPARKAAASPLRGSDKGSLIPKSTTNAPVRKSSSPMKKRRATLETTNNGDDKEDTHMAVLDTWEMSKQRRLEEDKRRTVEDARRREEDRQRHDEDFRLAVEDAKAHMEAERAKIEMDKKETIKVRTLDEQAKRVSDAIGSLYAIRLAMDPHADKLKLPHVINFVQACRDDKEVKMNRAVAVLSDGIMERLVHGDPNVFYWRHGLLDFDHLIGGRVFCDQGRSTRFRSLTLLRSEAINTDPEVLLVDDAQDTTLKQLADSVRSEIAKARPASATQVLQYLAQVVDRSMQRAPSVEEFKRVVQEMKKKVGSNLLRLGYFRQGQARHRAILYKYLCDALSTSQMPLRCRLVRGDKGQGFSWNVVESAERELMVLDLTVNVGGLIPESSREAEQYKRCSDGLTIGGIGGASVRGWLPPFDMSLVQRGPLLGKGNASVFDVHIKIKSLKGSESHESVENLALKEILLQNEQEVKFAHNELRLLRYVHHRNIVPFRYATFDSTKLYVFMEKMEGSGHDFIHQRLKKLPPTLVLEEIVYFLLGAARGISHLHTMGVMHRDIKPANILLKYDGVRLKEVRVSDFGLSILLDQTAYAKTVQIGTPNYMAPELLSQQHGGYDNKVDVYAFGIMLAEALLQEIPPGLLSTFPVERLAPVSKSLALIYERCIMRDPNARPKQWQISDYLEDQFLQRYLY